jgi:hypothetical protein
MNDKSLFKRPSTWIVLFLLISLYFVIRNSQPKESRQLTPKERADNAALCVRWGGTFDAADNCINNSTGRIME